MTNSFVIARSVCCIKYPWIKLRPIRWENKSQRRRLRFWMESRLSTKYFVSRKSNSWRNLRISLTIRQNRRTRWRQCSNTWSSWNPTRAYRLESTTGRSRALCFLSRCCWCFPSSWCWCCCCCWFSRSKWSWSFRRNEHHRAKMAQHNWKKENKIFVSQPYSNVMINY